MLYISMFLIYKIIRVHLKKVDSFNKEFIYSIEERTV